MASLLAEWPNWGGERNPQKGVKYPKILRFLTFRNMRARLGAWLGARPTMQRTACSKMAQAILLNN